MTVENINDHRKPPQQKVEITDNMLLDLWPSAREELNNFADHLQCTGSGLTADQIRLAVALGDEAAKKRPGYCVFCAEGNPRIRSSVSDEYVHTDTGVGRRLCVRKP